MKKFLFFLCGAFYVVCSVPMYAQLIDYQSLSDSAMIAIEQDSLDAAEMYIRRALKLDPANPRNALLFSNLGTVQRRQHRDEMALESYTFALNIVPQAVPILLNRAALFLELGRLDAARIDYSQVLDVEKDNIEALRMRAYVYLQQRDYKFARADYKRLLELLPADYSGNFGLATLEQKERRFKEALVVLNHMIAEDMGKDSLEMAFVYVARAGVENELGHAELALIDIEEAVRLAPSLPDAYLMRGQIYLAEKKKSAAKWNFEKAASLGGVSQAELRDLLRQCK